MFKWTSITFATILLLVTSGLVKAETLPYADVVDELNYLLTNKDYESAYQLAELYAFDYGGEPDFDLLLGYSAYGSGRFQLSVFAFERVVVNSPKYFMSRYFLAQSYSKLGNYEAALLQLEQVENNDLSPSHLAKIESLQRLIEKRQTSQKDSWYHIVGANLGYDSNINSGSDKDIIVIPDFGEIELFDSAKETSDVGYNLQYMGGYSRPLDQKRTVKLDYSINHFGYSEFTRFQRQQANINLSYLQKLTVGRFSVSSFVRPLWLQQEVKSATINDLTTEPETEIALYRIETGLGGDFSHDVNKQIQYRIGANVAFVGNEVNPELDFTRVKLVATMHYKSDLQHMVSLSINQDSSNDDAYDYNSKSVVGLTYQVLIPINEKWLNSSYLMFENHSFNAEHPIFKATRGESLFAASSQLMYRLDDHQQLKLQVNIQQKSSNVDLFNFNRVETSFGWQYAF